MAKAVKGGAKVAQYLTELQRKAADGMMVRVGFLEGSMHTTKTENGEQVSNAQVAAWNEWGNPDKGRPPRPFFRNMVQAKQGGWGKSLANLLKNNGGNAYDALDAMGMGISSQLQGSINEFADPPLAEATVKEKGFGKPLIDTGEMLRAVASEVVVGKTEEQE